MDLSLFQPSGAGDPAAGLSPEEAATANDMLSGMMSVSFEDMVAMMDSELTNNSEPGAERALSSDFNHLLAGVRGPSRGPSSSVLFPGLSSNMSAELSLAAVQLARHAQVNLAPQGAGPSHQHEPSRLGFQAQPYAAQWGGGGALAGGLPPPQQQPFQQQQAFYQQQAYHQQQQLYQQQQAYQQQEQEDGSGQQVDRQLQQQHLQQEAYQHFDSPFAEQEHLSDPEGSSDHGRNHWQPEQPQVPITPWPDPNLSASGFALSSGLSSIVYGLNPADKFGSGSSDQVAPSAETIKQHESALVKMHPLASNLPRDAPKEQGMSTLKQLEEKVVREIKQGAEPKQDVLVQTLANHTVEKLHSRNPNTLYAQMLRQAKSRVKLPGKGRTSAKERMDGLERQVADLQAQKGSLTDETENLSCRMNIMDRMIQLRREIADELLVHNVRLDEQLQATNLEKDIKQFFLENGQVDWAGLPSTKTIPEIMARLRSSGVFDEMSAFFTDVVNKLKTLLSEIDKLPPGTDAAASPLHASLEKEVHSMQAYMLQKQTEGGYLVAHWQMDVHDKATKINPTLALDLQTRYRSVYPTLQLTLQQKERIKLSYDIYTKRIAVMNDEKQAQVQMLETLTVTDGDMSMHERTREVLKANQALWRLRCINENYKEGHMMFNFIVMRKILSVTQLARLTVLAHPVLPCVLIISELVAQDLKKTYGLDTTERTAEEILKMCRNYNSKYMHLMTNS
eukprot:jgi/Tetstr1/422095/TSEL_012953.t1